MPAIGCCVVYLTAKAHSSDNVSFRRRCANDCFRDRHAYTY